MMKLFLLVILAGREALIRLAVLIPPSGPCLHGQLILFTACIIIIKLFDVQLKSNADPDHRGSELCLLLF